jgi:hypothetical protein
VRGAQASLSQDFFDLRIIPACAGSTKVQSKLSHLQKDHPRMCGEHVHTVSTSKNKKGSSPHVRGALNASDKRAWMVRIIPACAGSTLLLLLLSFHLQDHPRMCGEHRTRRTGKAGRQGSSPHVRGALRRQCGERVILRIIPACAGSTIKESGHNANG